jgi:hypothetical protein
VSVPRFIAAEDTVAILQRAVHEGVPAMIPGAWERRVGRPTAPPTNVTPELVASHARTATDGDRERLEYEREGGGAPSERMAGRQRSIFARLWHAVSHPS